MVSTKKNEYMKTNWTKEELKIYVLIYCANADLTESKVELDLIKSKIETSDFDKIHEEFNNDNDYQGIQKVQSCLEELEYSEEDKNGLLEEMKELFLSDDKYDILEKNLFKGLSRILRIK